MPRICKALSEFQQSWNNHKLSTEGNKTPLQLFFESLYLGSQQTDVDTISDQTDSPDTSGDIQLTSNEEIFVPSNSYQPCSALLAQLHTINPVQHSESFGKDLYYSAISTCGGHLEQGCVNC